MKAAYRNDQFKQVANGVPVRPLILWARTASRAEGPEAQQVFEVARKAQQHLNALPTAQIFHFENDDTLSYSHVGPKRVFSVKTQYTNLGKMKPRQFNMDE